MFRRDRTGRRGEGVILYIKEYIPAYEIQLKREAGCDKAVQYGYRNFKINWIWIGLVYRNPNTDEEDGRKNR